MKIAYALVLLAGLAVSACGSSQPSQVHNACLILEDNRAWWRALQRTEERWGVSPGTQLAILKRESSFNRNARPARTRLLGFIPGRRPSSAYGYAQALDGTWDWYKRETGRRGADRDDFSDAVDFVGWYSHMSGRLSNISPNDPRALYLAYHEGHGGYNRGTYRNKAWLSRAADQVREDATRYDRQLNGCEHRLNRGWIPFL
ncbi:MAG: transglycosylase SLT domain-containing protein [Pseudomonadota bacterium]